MSGHGVSDEYRAVILAMLDEWEWLDTVEACEEVLVDAAGGYLIYKPGAKTFTITLGRRRVQTVAQ